MTDSRDTDPADATIDDEPTHPLQRAHKFFLKAAPVIREVNETIDRHGGLEQVRDKVVERAGEFVKQVDEVVANATAIEGEVIERETASAAAATATATRSSTRSTPLARPVEPHRSPAKWIAIGVVTAAATYGALRLQRRD